MTKQDMEFIEGVVEDALLLIPDAPVSARILQRLEKARAILSDTLASPSGTEGALEIAKAGLERIAFGFAKADKTMANNCSEAGLMAEAEKTIEAINSALSRPGGKKL